MTNTDMLRNASLERFGRQAATTLDGWGKGAKNIFYIEQSKLPNDIKEWIVKNPGQSTFLVISGMVIVVPSLVTAPALLAAGFTPAGVAASKSLKRLNENSRR